MVKGVLMCVQSPIPPYHSSPSSSSNSDNSLGVTRRKTLIFTSSLLTTYFHLHQNPHLSISPSAIALEVDEIDDEEAKVVQIFQETSSSVVFIKDIELTKIPKSTSANSIPEEEDAKVEGTGSGFIWDKFGHIVTNYHVVSKLATDTSGLQRCKLGNYSSMEGVLYCKPHYEQLFKEAGNFTKNFQSPAKSAEKLTPELIRSPSKAAGMFSGTQDKCATCGKTPYPLEKEHRVYMRLDSCLDRYRHLYGSDARIFACLAELGVSLTVEPGFHQGTCCTNASCCRIKKINRKLQSL